MEIYTCVATCMQARPTHSAMKFDHIIMNPPYKRDLHLKILTECTKHLKEDGDIVNLSPARWIMDPLAKYKKNSDYYKYNSTLKKVESVGILSNVEASKMFSIGIVSDLGIYHLAADDVDAVDAASDPIVDRVMETGMVGVPVKKLGDCKSKAFFFLSTLGSTGGRERVPDTILRCPSYGVFVDGLYNGKTPKQIQESNVHVTQSGDISQWPVLGFPTEEEASNAYAYFKSKLMRYWKLHCDTANCVCFSYYPWLGDVANPRTGLIGFKSDWTDSDIYKLYGITDSMVELMEPRLASYDKDHTWPFRGVGYKDAKQ